MANRRREETGADRSPVDTTETRRWDPEREEIHLIPLTPTQVRKARRSLREVEQMLDSGDCQLDAAAARLTWIVHERRAPRGLRGAVSSA